MLLDVSDNKLKKLPAGLPPSLMMLYADHNEIESIAAAYLAKLPALQYLRVSYNQLKDAGVPAGVFNVSSLVELDLSYNKLTAIPEVGENLEHLYLQVNEIASEYITLYCIRSTVSLLHYITGTLKLNIFLSFNYIIFLKTAQYTSYMSFFLDCKLSVLNIFSPLPRHLSCYPTPSTSCFDISLLSPQNSTPPVSARWWVLAATPKSRTCAWTGIS